MIATKLSHLGILLTYLLAAVIGNPIHLPALQARDAASLPAQDSYSLAETPDSIASKVVAQPYIVEIRDVDTTSTSTLESSVEISSTSSTSTTSIFITTTTTTSERCAITLYRPTPYTQGSIKTVWASTRYLTSYQPCFDCTLFTYNPFTWKIPIKWESTTTVYDTPKTKLVDKCEPTKVSKTTKSTTTRKTTTATKPVYS